MLAHLLLQHAHVKHAESAASVSLRRTHAPHPCRLRLFSNRPVVVVENFCRIRIDTALSRNDLVVDDTAYLFAQRD
jgi:hypothetical protein